MSIIIFNQIRKKDLNSADKILTFKGKPEKIQILDKNVEKNGKFYVKIKSGTGAQFIPKYSFDNRTEEHTKEDYDRKYINKRDFYPNND